MASTVILSFPVLWTFLVKEIFQIFLVSRLRDTKKFLLELSRDLMVGCLVEFWAKIIIILINFKMRGLFEALCKERIKAVTWVSNYDQEGSKIPSFRPNWHSSPFPAWILITRITVIIHLMTDLRRVYLNRRRLRGYSQNWFRSRWDLLLKRHRQPRLLLLTLPVHVVSFVC